MNNTQFIEIIYFYLCLLKSFNYMTESIFLHCQFSNLFFSHLLKQSHTLTHLATTFDEAQGFGFLLRAALRSFLIHTKAETCCALPA